jgi:hypothetical protein
MYHNLDLRLFLFYCHLMLVFFLSPFVMFFVLQLFIVFPPFNLCTITLIFDYSSFIVILCWFFSFALCRVFCVTIIYCLSPFLFFYCPSFFTFFTFVFVSIFWLIWISSLVYPNLLGTKTWLMLLLLEP